MAIQRASHLGLLFLGTLARLMIRRRSNVAKGQPDRGPHEPLERSLDYGERKADECPRCIRLPLPLIARSLSTHFFR